MENEDDRIREVNSFTYRNNSSLDLKSIELSGDEPTWYGGNKSALGRIYIGSYNHFNVEAFLKHLVAVNWDDPEYVQVLLRNENEWNFSLYGNAGAELLYKALLQ